MSLAFLHSKMGRGKMTLPALAFVFLWIEPHPAVEVIVSVDGAAAARCWRSKRAAGTSAYCGRLGGAGGRGRSRGLGDSLESLVFLPTNSRDAHVNACCYGNGRAPRWWLDGAGHRGDTNSGTGGKILNTVNNVLVISIILVVSLDVINGRDLVLSVNGLIFLVPSVRGT